MDRKQKIFFGTTGAIFLAVFVLTIVLLYVKKPEWALENPATATLSEDAKKVDMMFAITYSLGLGALAATVYLVVGNMFVEHDKKLSPAVHSASVVIAAFIAVELLFFFVQPQFVMTEEKSGKEVYNKNRVHMIAVVVALVAGLIDMSIYKKNVRPLYEAPDASCYSGDGYSSTAKHNYKMSFPMKTTCGM